MGELADYYDGRDEMIRESGVDFDEDDEDDTFPVKPSRDLRARLSVIEHHSKDTDEKIEKQLALIEEERVKAAYDNTLVTMEAWHGTDDEQFAAVMNNRLEALKSELQTTLTEGKK